MNNNELDCQTKDHSKSDMPHAERDAEHRSNLGRPRPKPISSIRSRTNGSRRTYERGAQAKRSAGRTHEIKDDLS